MKKVLLVGVLAALFGVIGRAQDGSVTKQDALDYLNKMFRDFPEKLVGSSESIGGYVEKVSLDGCVLKIERSWLDYPQSGKTFTANVETFTFDLSHVYEESGKMSATSDSAIKVLFIQTTNKKKGGGLGKSVALEDGYARSINMFTLANTLDPEWGNTYGKFGEHYRKALDFLIQACGGGNKPAAPKEKF